MCKFLFVLICFGVECVFPLPLCAAQPDLASADWSVNSPRSLASNPPSDEAVEALLDRLEGSISKEAICLISMRSG
ncbi:MAG TPA: hypothetical protein VJX69_11360 [Terriglobales bacterium]|nr:hypothetical protein [Terriglobales bacterium]